MLRLTANAVERTILHIADNFARKVPELITSANGKARVSFSLWRLKDGSPVTLLPLHRVNIPRLAGIYEQYQASLAVMAGLHELSRNAFQATFTNRHALNDTCRDLHAWYDVSVDEATQSVRARLCNVSTIDAVTSKSIQMLQEIADNLGCIRLVQPQRFCHAAWRRFPVILCGECLRIISHAVSIRGRRR